MLFRVCLTGKQLHSKPAKRETSSVFTGQEVGCVWENDIFCSRPLRPELQRRRIVEPSRGQNKR